MYAYFINLKYQLNSSSSLTLEKNTGISIKVAFFSYIGNWMMLKLVKWR